MKSVLAVVLAAAALSGAAFAGVASAQDAATVVTNAPGNAFSFQKPAKWPGLDLMSKPGAPVTEYVSGTANEECYFDIVPRPETASATPSAIAKAWKNPISNEAWAQATSGQFLLRDGGVTVESAGLDTSKPFPFATAILKNAKNRVIAAMHPRPGFEIWTLCTAYDGKDHADQFKAIGASVATPKDAEWESQITAAAAPAAPPAAAADPKAKKK
jgi:hypothetical protein